VLVVDDHPGFRVLARRLLEDAGYTVVGEASTGAEAVHQVEQLKPDVVLLDIQLPDLDGFGVATLLNSRPAPPTIVLISSRDIVDYEPRMNECGAIGFIAKADLSRLSLRTLLGR